MLATASLCAKRAAGEAPGDFVTNWANVSSDPASWRSTCTHGHNGGAPSPCHAAAQAGRTPRSRPSQTISSASRVLPIPGSPVSSTSPPRDRSRSATCAVARQRAARRDRRSGASGSANSAASSAMLGPAGHARTGERSRPSNPRSCAKARAAGWTTWSCSSQGTSASHDARDQHAVGQRGERVHRSLLLSCGDAEGPGRRPTESHLTCRTPTSSCSSEVVTFHGSKTRPLVRGDHGLAMSPRPRPT